MDISKIEGTANPALDVATLTKAQAALLASLAADYRQLLAVANGVSLKAGGILYASDEIEERNATFEVEAYVPGFVAIGDDGGGSVFMLEKGAVSPVFFVGTGALGSAPMEHVADSVSEWVALGCPTPRDLRPAIAPPAKADVWLDVLPEGKLANLIAIKNELGLTESITVLKQLCATLPACIARDVPYGKFRVRCNALNARLGQCLTLRTS